MRNGLLKKILTRKNILTFCSASGAAFVIWLLKRDWRIIYGEVVDFFEMLIHDHPYEAIFVFCLLAIVSAMVSLFTSAPLIPFVNEVWGWQVSLILIYLSWIMGAVAAYGIGSFFGKWVSRWKLFTKLETYKQKLSMRSEFFLILIFRLGVPSEIASYSLGLLRYPFWKYLVVTMIAEVPFALLAVFLSDTLVSQKPFIFIALLAVGLLMMSAAFYFFAKQFKNHRLSKQDAE